MMKQIGDGPLSQRKKRTAAGCAAWTGYKREELCLRKRRENMNQDERTYLQLSLKRLREILPDSAEEMMKLYERDRSLWFVERDQGLLYCLFGFDVLEGMKKMILLVYDEENRIIADLGAYHMSCRAFLERMDIYDYLSEESDWMYLLHYVVSNTMFDSYPYPYCETNLPAEEEGQVLLYTNAYVSSAFRRKGIFRGMLERMDDQILAEESGIRTICSGMSMDPDIACYGPDAKEEPYYYSYEKDEPVRKLNAVIAGRLGFLPLKLEPDDPGGETDGTKLWFCVRKEIFEILEEAPA